MDDLRHLEAKGLARAKIRSKRRRASLIRRRTIRGSLALFAIAWAIIFGQLVTGNDPALSRSKVSRRLLASANHARPTPQRRSDDEGAAVAPSTPPSSDTAPATAPAPTLVTPATAPAPTPAPTPAPAPAPPPPPPPPIVTSSS